MPKFIKLTIQDLIDLGIYKKVTLPPQKNKRIPWVKKGRTLPIAIKDHKTHVPQNVNKAADPDRRKLE